MQTFILLCMLMALSACSGINQKIMAPENSNHSFYVPQKGSRTSPNELRDIAQQHDANFYTEGREFNRYGNPAFRQVFDTNKKMQPNSSCSIHKTQQHLYLGSPLSPGDRVQVLVHDGEEFSNTYEVDLDGTLGLPMIQPVFVSGHTPAQAEQLIAERLVQAGLFQKDFVRISLRPQQWAAVQVQVQGAVFNQGLVTINSKAADERAQNSTQWSGNFTTGRLISAALMAAGGVRPDADLQHVYLIRDNRETVIDMSGVFDGSPLQLPSLAAGDKIYVPESGFFQGDLVRPSDITPPGIRIFISNLTVPANNNASSAIGRHATSVPYGTRLLTAAVSANCVGGSAASNSNRTAILVSSNPLNGKTEIIERSIEGLLVSQHRDTFNPYVMPNDSVVCYDSGVTNAREVGRTLLDVLLPLSLIF